MDKHSKYLLILVLFLAFSLNGALCNNESTPVVTETPTTEVVLNLEPLISADATAYDASITAVYEQAEKEAKAWESNAELMMVSVKTPIDLGLGNSTVTFTYGSANVPQYWWTYSYSESTQKFVRALVYKDDYLGTALNKAIAKSFWRTNYIEALQIADAYQGADFRANNSNTTVTLTLMNGEPKGWLWWLVEYKSPDGNSISVRINPNDQTIVDESGNVITTYTPDILEETTTETTTTDEIVPIE